MAIPLSENARSVLEKRYLKKQDGRVVETPEDLFRRVAENIASVEGTHYGKSAEEVQRLAEEYYQMMANLEFMPNSPTLMNAGRELQQLAACFVLPVEDSMEGIFDSIKYAAMIHKSGGGTGFSFSRLRPKNDEVRSTGGVASGPVSFMKVFNAATDAVKQGGTRRGANMGILRVDHPDILEFITAKQDSDDLANFNISVALTEEFMQALQEDRDYPLINPRTGREVGRLRAKEVFDKIVDNAWKNGEPGIIFIDRINADNPTPALGAIESTNPCGEQPLLPYEACNLGSLNLARMVREREGRVEIDWERFRQRIKLAVRFLDDVIDASRYPLEIIDRMVKGNRKIGLGIMGFADLLIKLGVPYDSEQAVTVAGQVMSFLSRTAWEASEELAAERGPFPNFPHSVFAERGCRPVRNATTTTIAPTGTISIIAGCSSGIEPLFAVCFVRNVLDNQRLVEVNPLFEEVARRRGFYSPQLMELIAEKGTVRGIPQVPEDVQRLFVTALEIGPEWHVRIQAEFQKYTDNAVSKTINFRHEATREDVARAYLLAYRLGCKGITVYRDGSREEQVLTAGTKEKGKSAQAGSEAREGEEPGASCQCAEDVPRPLVPRPRPEITVGTTEKIRVGCGNLYVSVNSDEYGICEVFTNTGREGGCASQSEATSRLISIALRSGITPEAIIEQLRGIRCPACLRREGVKVTSCPDAIAKAIKKYLEHSRRAAQPVLPFAPAPVQGMRLQPLEEGEKEAVASQEADAPLSEAPVLNGVFCPECGQPLKHESGCVICLACGYSKCG